MIRTRQTDFGYPCEQSEYEPGTVLFRHIPGDDPEIGIVIQTWEKYGDYRTDMWGISCISERETPATLEQIQRYRPQILPLLNSET